MKENNGGMSGRKRGIAKKGKWSWNCKKFC
jgi:hypothetical protein